METQLFARPPPKALGMLVAMVTYWLEACGLLL